MPTYVHVYEVTTSFFPALSFTNLLSCSETVDTQKHVVRLFVRRKRAISTAKNNHNKHGTRGDTQLTKSTAEKKMLLPLCPCMTLFTLIAIKKCFVNGSNRQL